jgi:hypothetical protein
MDFLARAGAAESLVLRGMQRKVTNMQGSEDLL